MNKYLAVLSVAVLVGCVPQPKTLTIATPYSDDDFAAWDGAGPATIQGQAFLKTVGGDVKTCAGHDVILLPATKYNIEIMSNYEIYKSKINYTNRDIRADYRIRKSMCDAQGRFVFNDVPALNWYISTNVTWGVATRYGIEYQGGHLRKMFTIRPGINDIIMSDKDLKDR